MALEPRVVSYRAERVDGVFYLRLLNGSTAAMTMHVPELSVAIGNHGTLEPRNEEWSAIWLRDSRSWIPIFSPPAYIDHCTLARTSETGKTMEFSLECFGVDNAPEGMRNVADDIILATIVLEDGYLRSYEWHHEYESFGRFDGYSGYSGGGGVFDVPERRFRVSQAVNLWAQAREIESLTYNSRGMPVVHVGCSMAWSDSRVCSYDRRRGVTSLRLDTAMMATPTTSFVTYPARGPLLLDDQRPSPVFGSTLTFREVACE